MHVQSGKKTQTEVPLISFVVPCYNLSSSLVCACIDSILSLPLRDEERQVLVIDDGSEVPVASFLDKYGELVTCLRRENGGLSVARNTGLQHAAGRYVQFVDGDDALDMPSYMSCLRCLKQEFPDMLLFRFCGEDGSMRPLMSGVEYMLHYNLRASACTYLFRRELAQDLRFVPNLLHEDEAFTPLLMLKASTVWDTGLGAYLYRKRSDSITTKISKEHVDKRLTDKVFIITMLSEHASQCLPCRAQALRRRVAQLTMDYLVDTCMLVSDRASVCRRVEDLRRRGLYPLPVRNYTFIYLLFSILSAFRPGLYLCRFFVQRCRK